MVARESPSNAFASSSPPPSTTRVEVLVFGDSHTHALQRAVAKRKGKGVEAPLTVYRLLKAKGEGEIGDTTFEEFLAKIRPLGPQDVVVSVVGGNQHAVVSTIQHPQPFDFFAPKGVSPERMEGVEIIPYRALSDFFAKGLAKGDGKFLQQIREATRARVLHVLPPPPKADNGFIEQNHESLFVSQGLARRGVSPPALRLKFWELQTQVLARMCKKLNIELIRPPKAAVADGFLRPEYYASDATHANWPYGERLLREIEKRSRAPVSAQAGAA